MQRARKCHKYLYKNMPGPISEALRYVHSLGEKLLEAEQKEDNKGMSTSSQGSFRKDYRYPAELSIDYEYLKNCFKEMIDYFTKREERNRNKEAQAMGASAE